MIIVLLVFTQVTTKLNTRHKKYDYCACAYAPPVFNALLADDVVTREELIAGGGPADESHC